LPDNAQHQRAAVSDLTSDYGPAILKQLQDSENPTVTGFAKFLPWEALL
jgi:hypothetical protein